MFVKSCILFYILVNALWCLASSNNTETTTALPVMMNTTIGNSTDPKCPEKCKIEYRCSTESDEENAYALIDGVCRVFANQCLLDAYNCDQRKNCHKDAPKLTRDQCTEHCTFDCGNVKTEFLCAELRPIKQNDTTFLLYGTFANLCHLNFFSCELDTPYSIYRMGSCF